VHDSSLISGVISSRDTLALAILFGFIMLAQFLRLDERIASARRSKGAGRRFCGPDSIGDLVLRDPDGRAVRSPRSTGPPRGFVG
jgi:hypothetical protein